MADVLTRQQAAVRLGVNVRTIAREIERGNLKAFRVGRCIRITEQALSDYIEQQSQVMQA